MYREWANAIDPGMEGGSQPSFNERWPQDTQEDVWSSAYKDLEPADLLRALNWAGSVPNDIDMPNFTNLDRGQRVTGWGADPEEKTQIARQMGDAMTGALGNDPGMVGMGGKEFPNAYAIRSLMNPQELHSLRALWKRGVFPEKPATINTPSHLPTFQANDYGLVFNADSPEDIIHAGFLDLNSTPKKKYVFQKKSNPNLTNEDWEGRGDNIRRLLDDKAHSTPPGPQRRKYREALDRIDQWYSPQTETWRPSHPEYLIDPKTEGLDALYAKQLANQPTWGALGKTNEAVIRMSPENLAGIKLPWNLSDEDPAISEAFKQFGRLFGSDTFRIPGLSTRDQFLAGLQNPLAGTFGRPPRKDYITSSELGRILGITELP